jgi:serine phosphatase RsbU (regulator of sigma subunit)
MRGSLATIAEHACDSDDPLLALHVPRSHDGLRQAAARALARIGPGTGATILLCEGQPLLRRVELAVGNCPLVPGALVPHDAWSEGGALRFPLRHASAELGELVVAMPAASQGMTDAAARFAAHYAVAFVNRGIQADAELTMNQYFAGLNAFEEGVGLFQEHDRETVGARFLDLLRSLLGADSVAVLLLEEPGNDASPLSLDSILGAPEAVIDALALLDGSWWPPMAIAEGPCLHARDASGVLPVLDNRGLPPALRNILTCPLHYHGLTVGIGLAFNCKVGGGDRGTQLESVRRLGMLGAALFHRMLLEEEARRSQEVKTQLAIAAKIQAKSVPTTRPASPRVDCAWRRCPAQKVGGDYLDLRSDGDGSVHAIIADVSGHGIDSALLMNLFRATYRAECLRRAPASLLDELNRVVAHDAGDTGMFVTAAIVRIRSDGTGLTYASAGHNDLYVFRAATATVEALASTGPAAGFFPDAEFGARDLALAPGDVLLMYTDGLVEAKGPEGELDMYGDERLRALLCAHGHRPAAEILEALLGDLAAFAAICDDDVSVSVIRMV